MKTRQRLNDISGKDGEPSIRLDIETSLRGIKIEVKDDLRKVHARVSLQIVEGALIISALRTTSRSVDIENILSLISDVSKINQ